MLQQARHERFPTLPFALRLVEGPSFFRARTETFWIDMLHCRGGAFHAGYADDLERRMAQHEAGALPGLTSGLLPVTLVRSEGFPTRLEALAMECRLKDWSRAKKMTLIRSDWSAIEVLANATNGTATSSVRTDA